MGVVLRGVLPDAHEAFLHHVFGQITLANALQGHVLQTGGDATIQRFKGSAVAQCTLGQQLFEVLGVGD